MKEELFEYVSDVMPSNVTSLKNKAKSLVDKRVAESGSASPSSKKKDPEEVQNEIKERIATLKEKFEEQIEEQKERLLAENDDGNKALRFLFNDELLESLEETREFIHSYQSISGVSHLYKEVVSWFPEDCMTSKRLQSKLVSVRKGKSSSKKKESDSGEPSEKKRQRNNDQGNSPNSIKKFLKNPKE